MKERSLKVEHAPVRVGVIGCGKIAQTRHLPELLDNPDAQLAAVCDPDGDRAKTVAESFGVPQAYDSHEPLLASSDIDAVVVCAPNALHAEISLQALRSGKHVLVEKPMAIVRDDCIRMVEAAEQYGLVLAVGHNQRLHPVFRRAKQLIASGRIGAVIQFATQFQHGGPETWSVDGAASWFLQGGSAGFGVIGDLGVHRLDLMRWLLDDEIAELTVYSAHRRPIAGIEDNAALALCFSGGAIGTIQVGWSNPLQDHRTVIYGERGMLIMGETFDGITLADYGSGKTEQETVPLSLRRDGYLFSGVADDFVRSIRTRSAPAVSGREALRTMEALFRALPGP